MMLKSKQMAASSPLQELVARGGCTQGLWQRSRWSRMARASADVLAVTRKCASPRPYRESAPSEPRTTFPRVPCSKLCPRDGCALVMGTRWSPLSG